MMAQRFHIFGVFAPGRGAIERIALEPEAEAAINRLEKGAFPTSSRPGPGQCPRLANPNEASLNRKRISQAELSAEQASWV